MKSLIHSHFPRLRLRNSSCETTLDEGVVVKAGAATREHGLDALRSVLMLLGIPYHVSLIYSDRPWLVSSPESSVGLRLLGDCLKSFRMPAFFLLSGLLVSLAITRRPVSKWIRQRFERTGVPFLAGVILLNPFQIIAASASNSFSTVGALSLAQIFPLIQTQLTEFGPHWIRHLWFLPSILAISIVFVGVWGYRESGLVVSLLEKLTKIASRFPLSGLCLLAVVPIPWALLAGAVQIGLKGWEHLAVLSIVLVSAIQYFPAFMVGVVLTICPDLRTAVSNGIRRAPYVVGVSVLGYLTLRFVSTPAAFVMQCSVGVVVGVWLIDLFQRTFSEPSLLVRWLADGSLLIYLFHQPILGMIGVLMMPFGLGAWSGFLVVSILTSVVCLFVCWLARKSSFAWYLFNGSWR